ncbi:ATPase AAA+ type core [Botryosphaeria dothidea]|uniref:ATPase AAA+ type core n=1 Tax=Botryosphaeria dothidea TaxID=55169 RepID=A0A8H4NBJ5_9PEZI|nr:ATPase AAA+ type core [Botryosphaeria dothidea]
MTLAAGFTISISPQARSSYLALYSISRAFSTSTSRFTNGQYSRSDFSSQGFTGIYEPGQPTGGPLGGASIVGAPRVTPKALKQHLDQFVVGQERAKKVLSVAVYNHYQRIQELERLDDEEQELLAQQARREMVHRHPVEGTYRGRWTTSGAVLTQDFADEFPGQQRTINVWDETQHPPDPPAPPPRSPPAFGSESIVDNSPMTIEKSNILLLGPSGVGKTLMAKTLARVLEVPFSMSDCTPFTQAGYIGEDAEVCVQRLLAAANYDVAAAERGIIVLDEIDKIATAKVSHGKDVSGEGVQQALLKIIEGTTLQVQAKPERGGGGGRGPGGSASGFTYSPPGGGPGGPGGMGMNMGQPPSPKGEVFNVRTDNILFICTGAFIGLHKMILDRISKGSIGFGAPVRASNPETLSSDTTLKGEEALFRKHVPFYTPGPSASGSSSQQASFNTLDLVEPADLQKYGMIPELVGRIPISCALSSLDEEALVRVLTEPCNSLVKQYEQLFSLSSIELKFTSAALREIAKEASKMATGARGLRTVMERLLGEAQYECPGSTTKHVLVTREAAQRKKPLTYMSRGQQQRFQTLLEKEEEEEWKREVNGQKDGEEEQTVSSFEQYRSAGYA